MKNFTLNLKKGIFFAVSLALIVFSAFDQPEESTTFLQGALNKYYDNTVQSKELKRIELNVTNTGFCRYRKIYNNGKVEYFAFNLSRFKSMDYYGNGNKGELYLRTKNDDVIVQTRNDKKGEVDSTATFMVIPLKDIDVDQLNALADHFKKVNELMILADR